MHKIRDIQLMAMFGRNLQIARIARNLTQKDLGLVVNTSQTQISRVESGNYNISISMAFELMRALKLEANELFGKEHLTRGLPD